MAEGSNISESIENPGFSLSFDGVDDYARIENFPDISNGDASLHLIWVKVHSFNNGYIFGQWNGGTNAFSQRRESIRN